MIKIGMARMDHEHPHRRHPLIDAAAAKARQGALPRREFLRIAACLGLWGGSAAALLGPSQAGAQEAAASEARRADAPRYGGVLRCAMQVQAVADPAQMSWTEPGNLVRHQNEYLTITGPDNITRPMLAAGWSASDDLKTWTFTLREGVFWHSGHAFEAADVAFNIARWLDPATGSSNLGLFSAMLESFETGEIGADGAPILGQRAIEGAVEVVDPLTLRLHLSSPVLSMPENFYNYPTALVHRDFGGDIVAEKNGTGAYRILELIPGERCVLKRAEIDLERWSYWGGAAPHVGPGYLDEIHYIHVDPASAEAVEAVAAGRASMSHAISPELLAAARATPDAAVLAADTAQTGVIRMKLDAAPFDDPQVRRAVQLCSEPVAYLDTLFEGGGQRGEHHHVSPIHPDYYPFLPKPKRDVEGARRLLAAAGFAEGIDLVLTVGNTSGAWQQRACELFAEQAAAAGIRVTVEVVSAERYWEIWNTAPFGLTHWIHRPLGTMALSLGYRSGVPWNETGFSDPEFDADLTKAEALLDVAARREAMAPVQRRLQEAAVMVQPFWAPIHILVANPLKNVAAHPALYHQFNNVWMAG